MGSKQFCFSSYYIEEILPLSALSFVVILGFLLSILTSLICLFKICYLFFTSTFVSVMRHILVSRYCEKDDFDPADLQYGMYCTVYIFKFWVTFDGIFFWITLKNIFSVFIYECVQEVIFLCKKTCSFVIVLYLLFNFFKKLFFIIVFSIDSDYAFSVKRPF